ncbi:MAG: nuclear transport factor 2 family protein [Saprospiraceae bacterium]|nr:nuclear transport factor 2 family protein [Saprospiraceae bacterium]
MIAGSKADTYYMTDEAFGKASNAKNKELFLINGATHIETYWKPEYVSQAVNKLVNFYQANLKNVEQELIELSKQKWQWMADKNTDILADFFHEKSVFVHMGGTWGKDRELEIIKSGGIHYKKADIHEVSMNVMGNTAILLNKITLLAVVGGNEVTNPFMVTEVYMKKGGKWKLGSLSFTKLLNP